jgi:hypothetical protein
LSATCLKAADENPDKKKSGVTFHLNKSSKYQRLPRSQSQIVPGGALLDSESRSDGQILHKQPPEDFSDDDEPVDIKKGRAEDKKQLSLEDIKLTQGTAADLLRAYELASIQDAPTQEMECNNVLERLRSSKNNSFEIFQAALGHAQLKRIEQLQNEIVRLAQSQHFPKGAQIGVLHEDRHEHRGKQCRGCCFCNK